MIHENEFLHILKLADKGEATPEQMVKAKYYVIGTVADLTADFMLAMIEDPFTFDGYYQFTGVVDKLSRLHHRTGLFRAAIVKADRR